MQRPYVTYFSGSLFYGKPQPPPIWRTPLYRLSVTACAIYSQLHFVFGGGFFHPRSEDALYRGDRDPHRKWNLNYSRNTSADMNCFRSLSHERRVFSRGKRDCPLVVMWSGMVVLAVTRTRVFASALVHSDREREMVLSRLAGSCV
jgi:hypothetical protein